VGSRGLACAAVGSCKASYDSGTSRRRWIGLTTRFVRNVAIGGGVLSFRALFYRDYSMFAFMLALGALSGALYTLLEPFVRNRPRLHYLPWILCAYFAIGGVTAVGVLKHDEMSVAVLRSSWGVGLPLDFGRDCSICCGAYN